MSQSELLHSPTLTTPADTAERFSRLRKAVLDRRPILQEILKKCGQKNLYDYAKDYFSVNMNPPVLFRQEELIQIVRTEVANRLGNDVAESVATQLKSYYFVSTADHHGPITHPWFLNTNLLIAAPYLEHTDNILHNVLAFGCANVSLNNTSFPRGLLFHSCINGKVKEHRLSFLPSNSHSSSTYGFRAYTAQETKKMRTLLKEKVRNNEVHKDEANIIDNLLTEIYEIPDVLECKTYTEQVTKTNFALWKKFFPMNGKTHPNLIYLEQETLVMRLIINYHLHQDTTINNMLFNPEYDPLVLKYFDDVLYAFSTKEQRGTYLFWGISKENNYRVQLWKQGRYLVSSDGTFKIELTPEALREAMEKKQIVPSIMLIFIVLCFYYGLKCLGGFSQVNYLTFMKNAYIKMQTDRGNYRSIEVCARAQTKETVDVTVAFLGTPQGTLIPATGLDLILYGGTDRWKRLVEELKVMTVEDALNPGMPGFYKFIYPGQEGDTRLMSLTPEEITTLTGLDKKIRPCIQIADHIV